MYRLEKFYQIVTTYTYCNHTALTRAVTHICTHLQLSLYYSCCLTENSRSVSMNTEEERLEKSGLMEMFLCST